MFGIERMLVRVSIGCWVGPPPIQADVIEGKHVDHAQFAQGRQAHGALHVAGEDPEGAALWHQTAVAGGQAVEVGGHGVLANTEVQVAVRFGTLLEAPLPFVLCSSL